jgi:hypothetical protein
VGYIDVYRNGVKLGTADFTATSGTSVVLASGATAGDLVETVSFYVSSVLNAIPAVANAVTTSYINDGAVTAAKMAASGAWAPAGTVLQVVQNTYSTQTQISSTSYVDSGLSATITPTSSTSKILVIASMAGDGFRSSNNVLLTYQNIVRNSTQITEKRGYFGGAVSSDGYLYSLHNTTLTFLDSPATISSTTYKVQAKLDSTANDANIRYQTNNCTSVIILMEIAG